jgi:hypothetical protein
MSDPRRGSLLNDNFMSAAKTLLTEKIPGHAKTLFTEVVPDPVKDAGLAAGAAYSKAALKGAGGLFGIAGLTDAQDNLNHYMSGKGKTVNYSWEDIKKHQAFEDALGRMRGRFEAQSFVGKSGDKYVNKALLNLKDGQNVIFTDYWDADIGTSPPPTYLAYGRTGMGSNGRFVAERRGNSLIIKGEIIKRLDNRDKKTKKMIDEPFDFNKFQPGSVEAFFLENTGQAHPFNMHHENRQTVEAELTYEPDGKLTLNRVNWGPIH